MRRVTPALLLTFLTSGCTTDVAVRLQLDATPCAAQTQIAQVQLFVLDKVGTSLCVETQGVHNGPSGAATLPPVKPPGDVVVLALVYGESITPVDGGPPPLDGSPGEGSPPKDGSPFPTDGWDPCGDGYCDTPGGETCATCPQDCCTKMDLGPTMDSGPPGMDVGYYPDAGWPPLDGSKSFGLTGCVRCYALEKLRLDREPIDRQLVLTPVGGCKVPDSALDGLGVLAQPLPPPDCS
jgi:hypothetical protein